MLEKTCSKLRLIWQLATTNGVARRSLTVALIVGTILTMINQGDKIFNGKPPLWWKCILTYCVPFCVATYGAVSARLAAIHKAASLPCYSSRSHVIAAMPGNGPPPPHITPPTVFDLELAESESVLESLSRPRSPKVTLSPRPSLGDQIPVGPAAA